MLLYCLVYAQSAVNNENKQLFYHLEVARWADLSIICARCEVTCFTTQDLNKGSLAQLVEQLTFNQLVAGSNPARPTTLKILSNA